MSEFAPEPARYPDGTLVTTENICERFAKNGDHIRQGDVLLIKRAVPRGVAPVPRENGAVVLAHGEVTGHSHQLRGPQVTQFRDDTGHYYATVVGAPEPLVHEEHSAIPITDGGCELGLQVEYDGGPYRNVAD